MREKTPWMHKYAESKTTQIMIATVHHVNGWVGCTKYQATWFLLNRVYKDSAALTLQIDNCLKLNKPKQTKHWDVLEVVQFLSLVFNKHHEFKFLTSFYLLELKKDIKTEIQRYKTINSIIKRNVGTPMSMIKFTPTYRQLHISRYFSSLEPHTVVVSTVQPVPGWHWNGQSTLYLCHGVHHLWQNYGGCLHETATTVNKASETAYQTPLHTIV